MTTDVRGFKGVRDLGPGQRKVEGELIRGQGGPGPGFCGGLLITVYLPFFNEADCLLQVVPEGFIFSDLFL